MRVAGDPESAGIMTIETETRRAWRLASAPDALSELL
jgi:hypothetical protein